MSRRRGAAFLTVLFLLAACDSGRVTSPPQSRNEPSPTKSPRASPEGEVRVGVLGEPATLDPYAVDASNLTLALTRPLYPSLFRLQPDGEVRPELALSLEETASGARVRLREASWSDGRPITSRDVIASVEEARPPSGFARIRTAEAPGPRSVVLTGEVADWPLTLARAAPVLPFRRGVYGGPFVLAERTPGLELVLEPNSRWWGGSVGLERVRVRHIASLDIMISLLKRGELDVGATPSALNLGARLDAAGLQWSHALGWESLWADFGAADISSSERRAVIEALDLARMESVFVSSLGRLVGAPDRSAGTRPLQELEIAAPRDDELLVLYQEALYEQLKGAGIASELSAIESDEFYGGWLRDNPVDIAVRRSAGVPGALPGAGAADALPLARVSTVLAWRPGIRGPRPNPTLEGALWNLESWSREE
ncbi:MAG: ABC transporter substrate-binding protein [Actinomycetota bacterium]|nr:ABC transporter substrate-binding protein [Actinomycetota bacterium]